LRGPGAAGGYAAPIWDDDGPVSMVARTEAVAGVSRIQAVSDVLCYRLS
jgi:hypothetical protein